MSVQNYMNVWLVDTGKIQFKAITDSVALNIILLHICSHFGNSKLKYVIQSNLRTSLGELFHTE